MLVQTYLMFDGRTEEALNFYQKALGAEITCVLRFKDNPDKGTMGCGGPMADDKVMHSAFKVGETVVMASDGGCTGTAAFHGFSLSITAETEAEATRFFNNLAEGGQVQMPLAKTFFAKTFGVVADRFGVSWMVIVPEPMEGALPQKQHAHA
jgi:PhnB protein